LRTRIAAIHPTPHVFIVVDEGVARK